MDGAIDPTGDPGGLGEQRLDEFGNVMGEEIPTNISEEIMESMKNVWSVFDLEEKDQVTIDELPTIMRALDIHIDAPGALERVTAMIDPNNSRSMTFNRLKDVMEEELKDNDTIDQFIEQIRLLDRDGDGKIPTPEFK